MIDVRTHGPKGSILLDALLAISLLGIISTTLAFELRLAMHSHHITSNLLNKLSSMAEAQSAEHCSINPFPELHELAVHCSYENSQPQLRIVPSSSKK